MREHKKTKESGYFEGDSFDKTDVVNMGKVLQRSLFTTNSEDNKYKDRFVEYTREELETHIRPHKYSHLGICLIFFLNFSSVNECLVNCRIVTFFLFVILCLII